MLPHSPPVSLQLISLPEIVLEVVISVLEGPKTGRPILYASLPRQDGPLGAFIGASRVKRTRRGSGSLRGNLGRSGIVRYLRYIVSL